MDEHHVEIEERPDPKEGLYPSLRVYRPACTCGWHGKWNPMRAIAIRDGDEHENEMFS